MKIKKLLSVFVCATMLLSGFPVAFANETVTNSIWNSAYVTDNTQALYEDFPMMIDNTLGRDMSMSMQFQYLKNISSNDSVSVTITDLADNSIIAEYDLTQNDTYIIWNDVENNKSFSIKIDENINDIQKEYIGIINTKNVKAEFPANLTLGNIEYTQNSGEEFDGVLIKKVGARATCNHNENEECVQACTNASLVDFIESENLDTFYSELDANNIYEMQMEAKSEGATSFYRGYISTYSGGENLGIFTRGYTLSIIENFANINNITVSLADDYAISTLSTDPSDYDFTLAYDYRIYQDEMVTDLTSTSDYLIKWTVPEEGFYTIETIGNVDTQLHMFSETDNGIVYTNTYYDGGTGGNVSKSIWIRGGLTRYFVWNKEDGDSGASAFRIIRDDYNDADGISAYRSEVKAAYEAGNFSPTNNSCNIMYNGDINIFAYSTTAGNGYLAFENVETPLTVEVKTISGTVGGFDRVWTEGTYQIPVSSTSRPTYVSIHTFSKEIHYIDIKQQSFSVVIDDENSYTYNFDFYDPRQKDSGDISVNNGSSGDNPIYPVVIPSLPYNNTTRTLHRGENDYFKLTTGEYGGNIDIKLYKTTPVDSQATSALQYNVELYDYDDVELYPEENAWNTPDSIGTVTTQSNYKQLTYSDLLPNHDYLIGIKRPDAATYSSIDPYTINVSINLPSPTATLSGNVALTHVSGNDISDLSAILNTIMESMNCTFNGVSVDDATAVADVELYYNGEILTTAIVNSLSAGTYTIVPKYHDVTATGGTVTLTIENPPAGTVVNLSGVTLETVTNANWDWTACAKMAANVRLSRESSAATTKSVGQAIIAVKGSSNINVRGNISETANAANFFYTNGSLDTYNFYESTINESGAENVLLSKLQNGEAVILLLTSATNPTSYESARYLLLTGINTGNHTYTVFDPTTGNSVEISESVLFNGGYNSNSDLRFTGVIIEFA